MNKRLGFVGIVIDSRVANINQVNEIISLFSAYIVARMGVPYQEKSCSVITLVVDMDTDTLGKFTGKLGNCPQVSVKSALSKEK